MLSEPLNIRDSSAPAQGSSPSSPSSPLFYWSTPVPVDEAKFNHHSLSKILDALAYCQQSLLSRPMWPTLAIGPDDTRTKVVDDRRTCPGGGLVQRHSAFRPVEKSRLLDGGPSTGGRPSASPGSFLVPSFGCVEASSTNDVQHNSELRRSSVKNEYVVQAVESFFLPHGCDKGDNKRRHEDEHQDEDVNVPCAVPTTVSFPADIKPDVDLCGVISTSSTFSETRKLLMLIFEQAVLDWMTDFPLLPYFPHAQ